MTGIYTYDDFVKAAGERISQFSAADLDTAKLYPDFGMSLLTLKQDYANAGTDAARALLHAEAEQLRSNYGNYASRGDGTGYYSLLRSPDDFGGDSRLSELLDRMENFPSFSYDKVEDPNYASYKKEALREGERASTNALAQAAALTGGIPSSYAQTAALQAGDYYAAQLSDKLPELYRQAYERYLDDFKLLGLRLSALQGQDETSYARFLDENEFQQKRAEQASDILAEQQEAGGNALPYDGNGMDDGAEDKFSGDAIAQAARQYYDAHPNVKLNSRTLDNWLNANGYSGASARTFKAYLESYGAEYERGY